MSSIIDPFTKYCILAYAYLTAFILYIRTFRVYLNDASKHMEGANQVLSGVFKQIEDVAIVTKQVLENTDFRDQIRGAVNTFQDEISKKFQHNESNTREDLSKFENVYQRAGASTMNDDLD